ncbi:hypothetical protein [Deinococcus detaillensis]|uniref:hypothetical protein n=1 Tax=Deinococcus detaillensis TaxID=2592048 RepID=UPI001CDC8B62|nr:hypothetical protein [Deinococcus detaillensis]
MTADGALRLPQGVDESGYTAFALKQQQNELHPDGFGQGLEDLGDPRQVAWIGMFWDGMVLHGINPSSVLPDEQK